MKATTKSSISVHPPPRHLKQQFKKIFTDPAVTFLTQLVTTFAEKTDELYWNRLNVKCSYKLEKKLPKFLTTPQREDKSWRVAPVPLRLINRRLDLGDVSPANTLHFCDALNANVQGIQVDFDDGHCPNWENQIIGLSNVYDAVHGNLVKNKNINNIPILMLRPRAWNMTEHNIMINGKKVPGPLVDFGLLIFHNHKILINANAGPFFYLSKVEGAREAKLWNDIFVWTQRTLKIPQGTIKACVLIENILSSFEMEEILYELKDHSLGLNCGIWDYAASIICKFGDNSNFILPDRNKYVNMQRHFLKKYMQLVVKTCHARGAHATGGMAALLIEDVKKDSHIIEKVVQSKKLEIESGVDGFMVYDLKLVSYMNKLWNQQCGKMQNQLDLEIFREDITESDLLKMPTGGVTFEGLKHNIEVAILFIFNWFNGNGHFFYKGAVEDSATAEISRSQIWQWIRHMATIEDDGKIVTLNLVEQLTIQYLKESKFNKTMYIAAGLFLEIITTPIFPDFITTYLNDNYVYQQVHKENKFDLLQKL